MNPDEPPPPFSSSSSAPCFVIATKRMIGHTFVNKKHIEDALTHESFAGYNKFAQYEQIKWIGYHVLKIAICDHLVWAYPNIDFRTLFHLRDVNTTTEKLASIAVHLNLHTYLRHDSPPLLLEIKQFAEAVAEKNDPVSIRYEGMVKAPKVLADVVKSMVGAIFMDIGKDPTRLSEITKDIFKPTLFTLDDLEKRRQAAKAAKAVTHEETNLFDGSFEIESAKQALLEICEKKRWSKPEYRRVENDSGSPDEKKYICSVKIITGIGNFEMSGDEKSEMKDAENSAAFLMIQSLKESHRLGRF